MNQKEILEKTPSLAHWTPPVSAVNIKHGDMPGDKVCIQQGHRRKADVIFPELLKQLPGVLKENAYGKAVITVCGGSGVGKSEIASLISYYFEQAGIGSYTLSGDNYPRRIPRYNDGERLGIFRRSGIRQMIAEGVYTQECRQRVKEYQLEQTDADPSHGALHPWYSHYISGGISGLKGYLGTDKEIDFSEVENIVTSFKRGQDRIYLKRMGREETELWYDDVDFSGINVLLIEWTHGNSDFYKGVDIPILLNSTPEETLAHRRARNRDGKTDSPFTMRVLEIEQEMLKNQAHKAKLIVSKQGELLSFKEYQALMNQG